MTESPMSDVWPKRAGGAAPIRAAAAACRRRAAGALDDFLGAAVAGAGHAGDRDRTVSCAVVARALAVAAAAGARRRCSSCLPSSTVWPRCFRSSRCACRACATAAPARSRQRAARIARRPRSPTQLAVTPKDPYSLALWNAHVDARLAAARTLKSGAPSPRLAWRDPYALRALVLIACIATFLCRRRRALEARRRGVRLAGRGAAGEFPRRCLGDAAGLYRQAAGHAARHPSGRAGERSVLAEGPIACRSTSTLIVRSTGKLSLDVAATGGVTPAADDVQRAGRHRRTSLQDHGDRHGDAARRRRGSGLAVQRHSRQAADYRADQGSGAAEPRLAAACPTTSKTITA